MVIVAETPNILWKAAPTWSLAMRGLDRPARRRALPADRAAGMTDGGSQATQLEGATGTNDRTRSRSAGGLIFGASIPRTRLGGGMVARRFLTFSTTNGLGVHG